MRESDGKNFRRKPGVGFIQQTSSGQKMSSDSNKGEQTTPTKTNTEVPHYELKIRTEKAPSVVYAGDPVSPSSSSLHSSSNLHPFGKVSSFSKPLVGSQD